MEMIGTPPQRLIFHVHPSLRCNLACAHCYSHSAPGERDFLTPDEIAQAVRDAAAIGFDVLSVSGGEPLLYDGLDTVLAEGRANTMRTQVASNGWFLHENRFARVADLLDLVAVSMDGSRALHDRLRGSDQAFDRLLRGLAVLRDTGRPFGLIHTVTAANWRELFETAEFAADQGARLFQIHAIEAAGRAVTSAQWLLLNEEQIGLVYVIAALLKVEHQGPMFVQADLQHRDQIVESCAAADPSGTLGTLVLEADGTIVPLAYGFDRRFAICNIRERPLAEAWPLWVERTYPRFLALVEELRAELRAPDGPEVFNWFELMVARSGAKFHAALSSVC